MKKLMVLILMVVMLFSFTACGSNNDENNAIMQAKIDESKILVTEICDWYKDNGFLEGDAALEIQPIVDQLTTQIGEIEASHQEVLDAGGYDDEKLKIMAEALDTAIEGYNQAKEELKKLEVTIADQKELDVLIAKYNDLVTVVNDSAQASADNGWYNDESFSAELDAVLALLDVVGGDLVDPTIMTVEYREKISTSFDELLPLWKEYLIKVSEPYTVK